MKPMLSYMKDGEFISVPYPEEAILKRYKYFFVAYAVDYDHRIVSDVYKISMIDGKMLLWSDDKMDILFIARFFDTFLPDGEYTLDTVVRVLYILRLTYSSTEELKRYRKLREIAKRKKECLEPYDEYISSMLFVEDDTLLRKIIQEVIESEGK